MLLAIFVVVIILWLFLRNRRRPVPNVFKGKVCLVTGAGSGIGRALAHALALRGARLAISDINVANVEETLNSLPASTDAKAYCVDVSSRTQVFENADTILKDFGDMDFVFNNAGLTVAATVEHSTIEELEKVMR